MYVLPSRDTVFGDFARKGQTRFRTSTRRRNLRLFALERKTDSTLPSSRNDVTGCRREDRLVASSQRKLWHVWNPATSGVPDVHTWARRKTRNSSRDSLRDHANSRRWKYRVCGFSGDVDEMKGCFGKKKRFAAWIRNYFEIGEGNTKEKRSREGGANEPGTIVTRLLVPSQKTSLAIFVDLAPKRPATSFFFFFF